MKRISLAATLALTCAITGLSAAQSPQAGAAAGGPPAGGDDKKVTLTGCVVKGDEISCSVTPWPGQVPRPRQSPRLLPASATTTTTTTPGKPTVLYGSMVTTS